MAVSIIIAAFFLAVILLLALLIPVAQAQIAGFLSRVPAMSRPALPTGAAHRPFAAGAARKPVEGAALGAGSQAGTAIKWAGGLFTGMLTAASRCSTMISLVIVMPLVAFYLLRDWDRLVAQIDDLLPRTMQRTVREKAAEIDRTLAAFVRGQALVCLLLGTFYAIGLSLVGLEFGMIVGFGTGIMSFIPYFGMALGLIVGMGIAFAQFSEWLPILLTAAGSPSARSSRATSGPPGWSAIGLACIRCG
jgi:predicted PurR-regulated permease PerM